jgi:2-methylcitrate dehydratase PrpD
MGITEKTAKFIVETNIEKIPEAAIKAAKECMFDCLSCTLAGSAEPCSEIGRKVISEMGGKPQCRVIGGDFKTSAPLASLAHGIMAHALDYDDFSIAMTSHPSSPVLPLILSLGEAMGISGEKALESYIIGIEVETKIASGINPSRGGKKGHHEKGWHTTSTIGTLGATAAAAKILDLNLEETAMALGIASSMASGIRENFGTMTKPLHAGIAAKNGVLAGLLAKEGFTASKSAWEGNLGFCQLFSGEAGYNLEEMDRFGNPFELISPGISIKFHPSCQGTPAGIDVTLELIKEHNIFPDMVEKVEVGVGDEWWFRTLIYTEPKSGLEGKFSMQYCIAAALLDGEVGLRQFVDEKVRDPKTREIMKRVEMIVHPEARAPFLERYGKEDIVPANVKIRLLDGKEYFMHWNYPKGAPKNPLTKEELSKKCKDCAIYGGFSEKVIDQLSEVIEKLEEIDNVGKILDIIG